MQTRRLNPMRMRQHITYALALWLCLSLAIAPCSYAYSAAGDSASAQPPPGLIANQAVPAAVPAYRQANHVAIITVDGVIDNVTLKSLERRIKKAKDDGADAVVLDINTPGGEMGATLDICNLLKSRAETPANVVAWVHPTAYSAGTIMSLACREIIVSPNSTMGDAAPIQLNPLTGLSALPPTERAKALSPLLTEIIDSARRNHYDEKLVQAFVMVGQELWMIENITTGERAFVDRAEYRTIFGEEPPQQFGAPPHTPGIFTSAPLPWFSQNIPRAQANAGDPQQLLRDSLRDQSLPPVRPALTAADRNQWRLLMQITDGTTLLTLKPDEAVYYGLAKAVVASDADIAAYFGAQTVTRYDQTWSEHLVRFLISWPVRAILIVIFLVCLFIELAMPGFGIFGTTAIIALLALIGAPALVGMAQWWDVLLIVVGLALVAAELFIIPGFGVAGVAGAACLLVGLVGTFVSDDITSSAGQSQLWTGLTATLTSVFVAGIAIWFISRQLHSIPLVNRLILHTELKEPAAAASGPSLLQAMGGASKALQPGDTGIAETDLRPAGRANIDGRVIDVKSIGTYIDKGAAIRVVSVGKFVIEVEEISA